MSRTQPGDCGVRIIRPDELDMRPRYRRSCEPAARPDHDSNRCDQLLAGKPSTIEPAATDGSASHGDLESVIYVSRPCPHRWAAAWIRRGGPRGDFIYGPSLRPHRNQPKRRCSSSLLLARSGHRASLSISTHAVEVPDSSPWIDRFANDGRGEKLAICPRAVTHVAVLRRAAQSRTHSRPL